MTSRGKYPLTLKTIGDGSSTADDGSANLTIRSAARTRQIDFSWSVSTNLLAFTFDVGIDGKPYVPGVVGYHYPVAHQLKYRLIITPGVYTGPDNALIILTRLMLPVGPIPLISGTCTATGTVTDAGAGGNPPLTPYIISANVMIDGANQGISPDDTTIGNVGDGAYALTVPLVPGLLDPGENNAFFLASTKFGSTTTFGTNSQETILNL